MIPGKTTDRTVSGDIEGEKIAMGLDENGLAHIMSMLTDVYNDPELAVLREYSTNAMDSHIEAGQTRPIEVTLPNTMSPFLKIKDYGVGLGRMDIINVYSKYGASTKRETNDQTGSLGIGGKSALTYNGTFSVVGIKDELRTMISVARDEDDGGSMTILEESETTEPNGVEIIIPVKRMNELGRKAQELFQYWRPGTVLVNGEEPKHVEGLYITKDILLVKKDNPYGYEENYLVMGGVPYQIPHDLSPFESNAYTLVAYVAMGDVNFPPSREALQLTRKTKSRLELLKKEIDTALGTKIQSDIDEASTAPEAGRIYLEWMAALRHKMPKGLQYNDKEFPSKFAFPEEEREELLKDKEGNPQLDLEGKQEVRKYTWRKRLIYSYVDSIKVGEHHVIQEIDFTQYLDCVQVTGFDIQEFAAPHKRKLEIYCREHDLKPKSFLLTRDKDGPVDIEWIAPQNLIEWKDVKDIKLERKAPVRTTGPKRLKGLYPVYRQGSYAYTEDVPANELPTDKPLYHIGPREFTNGENLKSPYYKNNTYDALALLRQEHDCTIVDLSLNRVEKFKRDFPMAKDGKTALEAIYDRLVESLTLEELEGYEIKQSSHGCQLDQLDQNRINDLELKRLVSLVRNSPSPVIMRIKGFEKVMSYIHRAQRDQTFINTGSKNAARMEVYPLLDCIAQPDQDHTYIYLNHIYSINQKGK